MEKSVLQYFFFNLNMVLKKRLEKYDFENMVVFLAGSTVSALATSPDSACL